MLLRTVHPSSSLPWHHLNRNPFIKSAQLFLLPRRFFLPLLKLLQFHHKIKCKNPLFSINYRIQAENNARLIASSKFTYRRCDSPHTSGVFIESSIELTVELIEIEQLFGKLIGEEGASSIVEQIVFKNFPRPRSGCNWIIDTTMFCGELGLFVQRFSSLGSIFKLKKSIYFAWELTNYHAGRPNDCGFRRPVDVLLFDRIFSREFVDTEFHNSLRISTEMKYANSLCSDARPSIIYEQQNVKLLTAYNASSRD